MTTKTVRYLDTKDSIDLFFSAGVEFGYIPLSQINKGKIPAHPKNFSLVPIRYEGLALTLINRAFGQENYDRERVVENYLKRFKIYGQKEEYKEYQKFFKKLKKSKIRRSEIVDNMEKSMIIRDKGNDEDNPKSFVEFLPIGVEILYYFPEPCILSQPLKRNIAYKMLESDLIGKDISDGLHALAKIADWSTSKLPYKRSLDHIRSFKKVEVNGSSIDNLIDSLSENLTSNPKKTYSKKIDGTKVTYIRSFDDSHEEGFIVIEDKDRKVDWGYGEQPPIIKYEMDKRIGDLIFSS